MAVRPVFVADDVRYVKTINTEFIFYTGLSKAQRQRSFESLHEAFKESYSNFKILEVSGFSKNPLGNRLSAFQLMLSLKDGTKVPVEVAYQGGKIFENGGPYKDLLKGSPKDAKKDTRLCNSGKIVGFDFEGIGFPLNPATLFYTWLYLHALNENEEIANELLQFNAFTDIVFNPQKSISCQARVCALYISLRKKGELEKALTDIDFLSEVLKKGMISPQRNKSENKETKKRIVGKEPFLQVKKEIVDSSMIFKIGDIINHPKFGKGIIKCIEPHGSTNLLMIRFDAINEEKKLSEIWVRENCK